MPSNNKIAVTKAVYFVSTRTQENLPFIPCLLINFILWSILARAKSKYDIKICAFLFMGNHLHLILVTRNPKSLDEFMAYIKRESSHAINDLLGRDNHTVWCSSYDSPLLLTPEDVIAKIVYIYLNPVKAGLVRSIREYPGVSSWNMFLHNKKHKNVKGFSRSSVHALSSLAISEVEQKDFIQKLIKKSKFSNHFVLEPWAWTKCFRATRNKNLKELKDIITNTIKNKEAVYQKEIKTFLGPEAMKSQQINAPHTPKKRAKKLVCICSDPEIRIAFLHWYNQQQELARKVRAGILFGGDIKDIPPGFYASGGHILCNLIGLPSQFET